MYANFIMESVLVALWTWTWGNVRLSGHINPRLLHIGDSALAMVKGGEATASDNKPAPNSGASLQVARIYSGDYSGVLAVLACGSAPIQPIQQSHTNIQFRGNLVKRYRNGSFLSNTSLGEGKANRECWDNGKIVNFWRIRGMILEKTRSESPIGHYEVAIRSMPLPCTTNFMVLPWIHEITTYRLGRLVL